MSLQGKENTVASRRGELRASTGSAEEEEEEEEWANLDYT